MKSSLAFPLLLNCADLSIEEYLLQVERALLGTSLMHIVTLNAEMVVAAQKNDLFRKAIMQAELIIPDGSSILWARRYIRSSADSKKRTSFARLLASLIAFLFSNEQTITGVQSILDISKIVERHKGTVILVGGKTNEAKETARILQETYPHLSVSVHSEQHISGIRKSISPKSVVFVALGAPKQTLWIEQNRALLADSGVRMAIGIGGAFAMISGTLPRAPKWMQRHHLEWLWRLFLEPRRIRRIWNAVVTFPRLVRGYPH